MQGIENELYIKKTDEYHKLLEMQKKEKDKLTEIAKKFLDDNDITNENIREAYIDAYVDCTEKVWNYKNEYKIENQYKMLPGLYLTFARAINDKELEEEILELNFERREELLKEIEELEKYLQTEKYEEEVKNNLEEV